MHVCKVSLSLQKCAGWTRHAMRLKLENVATCRGFMVSDNALDAAPTDWFARIWLNFKARCTPSFPIFRATCRATKGGGVGNERVRKRASSRATRSQRCPPRSGALLLISATPDSPDTITNPSHSSRYNPRSAWTDRRRRRYIYPPRLARPLNVLPGALAS